MIVLTVCFNPVTETQWNPDVPRQRHDRDDRPDLNLPPGEYSNPVERFAQLPEPTRRWLEDKRAADFVEIDEALRFYHSIKTLGRFWKWLIISVTAILLLFSQFGEALQKAWRVIFYGVHGP